MRPKSLLPDLGGAAPESPAPPSCATPGGGILAAGVPDVASADDLP